MKVGIVCSHGGHLTEMRYILNRLNFDDIFFITYQSSITETLKERKYLFPNFGNKPWKSLKFIIDFIKILNHEKPNVLISNGAEIAIPIFIIAKIFRIRLIFIECYTRINEPTITGKILFPLCNTFIIPWKNLYSYYGSKAIFIDNIFSIINSDKPINIVGNEILVIVGMHNHGFDRLVQEIDSIAPKLPQSITIQIGSSQYVPKNCKHIRYTGSYEEMIEMISRAQIVISQGGMTVIDCLLHGTRVIAVPRKTEFNEAISNHQDIFSNQLGKLKLLYVVDDLSQLHDAIINSLSMKAPKIIINDIYIKKINKIILNNR